LSLKNIVWDGVTLSLRSDDMRLTQRRRGAAACEVNLRLKFEMENELSETTRNMFMWKT